MGGEDSAAQLSRRVSRIDSKIYGVWREKESFHAREGRDYVANNRALAKSNIQTAFVWAISTRFILYRVILAATLFTLGITSDCICNDLTVSEEEPASPPKF